MTRTESWHYEERVGREWISCGASCGWTFTECQQKAGERKIVSPKSVLRLVQTFRTVYDWRERKKIKA